MSIDLTDEQRQAVQKGRPVEVIDSTTNLRLILLSADLYQQRVQEVVAEGPQRQEPATPALTGQPPVEYPPLPCRLKDLETPPEVAEVLRRRCRELGIRGKKALQEEEEQLKLHYYFGQAYVGYLKTSEGRVIVAAGNLDSDEFGRQLDALSAEERRRVVLLPANPWNDPNSLILTSFFHES